MAAVLSGSAPVEMEDKLSRTAEWAHDMLLSLGMDPGARGVRGEALAIPLDEPVPERRRKLVFRPVEDDSNMEEASGMGFPVRRRRSRRDSQRRRDALLRGKEGSRQRRRWENDRLLHVPNAQPPLPSDWEARPTHTVYYDLPYHLAQYWDQGLREMINERRAAEAVLRRQQLVARQAGTAVPATPKKKRAKKSKKASAPSLPSSPSSPSSHASPASPAPSPTFGMVTRDLRAAVKKSETVKVWIRALEEPVRQYAFAARAARVALLAGPAAEPSVGSSSSSLDDDRSEVASSEAVSDTYALSDDEDDELVFVGRRSLAEQKKDDKHPKASWRHVHREVDDVSMDSGVLFDSLGDGETGSFKRWIAHSLSEYYGFSSQSTDIDATKRGVYVCMRAEAMCATAGPILIPRPMWEVFETS